MSNEHGSPLNASQSELQRTNKPLVVSCDYNTNLQDLTFDSAQGCSCDELRAVVKETFNLTKRPFKMWWDDNYGEQNFIQDEATLDEAIEYYQSADEVSITISIKISQEYDGRSHLGVVRGEADEVYHADFSSPLRDPVTTSPTRKDAGKSTLNTVPRNPPMDTHSSPDSRAASTRSVLNGSTGARSSCSTTFSQHLYQTGRKWSWVETQARDPILDALGDAQSLSSLSLSGTDPSMSDGVPPDNRAHRNNYSSSRFSGPLEYEALVNGSQSNYNMSIDDDSPREFTTCSECECILDSFKYTCTTCGGKTPMTRVALLAAAGAKRKGRDRAASIGTSPTRTILGRGHSSSVSSSSTARAGYELCSACFGKDAIDHSWAFCVSGSFSTPKELAIARRSQPKQKGLLRHVFVEKFWDLHSWTDLVQENMQRDCSICKTGLSEDRYRCGSCDDFMLCRGCFSIVHNVHPTHPFLDKKAKPATETPNHVEISEDITMTDDNSEESPLKHVGYQCSYCELDIVGPRFECAECVDINLCLNCDNAGLLPTESEHRSSHTMSKITIPVPRDASQMAHGQRHRKNSAGPGR